MLSPITPRDTCVLKAVAEYETITREQLQLPDTVGIEQTFVQLRRTAPTYFRRGRDRCWRALPYLDRASLVDVGRLLFRRFVTHVSAPRQAATGWLVSLTYANPRRSSIIPRRVDLVLARNTYRIVSYTEIDPSSGRRFPWLIQELEKTPKLSRPLPTCK